MTGEFSIPRCIRFPPARRVHVDGRADALCGRVSLNIAFARVRGVVYSGHFDWLLGGNVAAAEMRMRSVWVEVESGDNLCLENMCLVQQ